MDEAASAQFLVCIDRERVAYGIVKLSGSCRLAPGKFDRQVQRALKWRPHHPGLGPKARKGGAETGSGFLALPRCQVEARQGGICFNWRKHPELLDVFERSWVASRGQALGNNGQLGRAARLRGEGKPGGQRSGMVALEIFSQRDSALPLLCRALRGLLR